MAVDTSPLAAVGNLPGPAKAGLAVLGGAGILAGIYMLVGQSHPEVIGIIAAGMVIVALLLLAFKYALGWLRKRRAAPLERAILDNSAAAPNSVSGAASRARLDDLRRSFENGVQKFKDSGKNIYSLPWYLLVGEPGSGKTEAVRHCNVGFPPGLQDELQGAGGTINMNWWFTNHAIIVDTAGRLMFEEVAPGATSEWKEFLGMLTRVRPNCPINGMLLVIPADSLIRDTADSISKKAGKIAQQLDSIQRSLGVRFPVFIVVTKCDLINGFREFFDGLNDPQLQHQILGWSNPNPLDTPFSPDQVEQHLKTVSGQLARRRQGLLLDPVNTEDPDGRRIDQVDALYAFPESLLGIAPRLRRYLEMVFVAGEWSPKPLFLRGIYFTSSMREGAALDKELADVLGVPVESLPEGKVWERDRAYFLRDLFIQKVFKEKGLVTRASNTRQLQRQRKMAVIVASFIAVILLLGLTWFGSKTLEKSIGQQRDFWNQTRAEYTMPNNKAHWPMVVRERGATTAPAKYAGADLVRNIKEVKEGNRSGFYTAAIKAMRTPIEIPAVFKPLTVFSDNPIELRREAYKRMYTASVLSPLLDTVRDRLKREEDWSVHPGGASPTDALAQLIRLESYAAQGAPAKASEQPVDLDPLFRYALEGTPEIYSNDKKMLQEGFELAYPKSANGTWNPPDKLAGTSPSADVIKEAMDRFGAYWSKQAAGQSPRLEAMKNLRDSLDRFHTSELALAEAAKNPPARMDEYRRVMENTWTPNYEKLAGSKADADRYVAELEAGGGATDVAELRRLLDEEIARIQKQAQDAHQALLNQLPKPDDKSASAPRLKEVRAAITDGLAKLDGLPAKAKELGKGFEDLEAYYLPRVKGAENKRRYAIHFDQVYARVNQRLVSPGPAPETLSLSNTSDALSQIAKGDSDLLTPVRNLPATFATSPDRINTALKTAEVFVDSHASFQRHNVIEAVLKNAPARPEEVAQKIGALVSANKGDFAKARHPRIPFTPFTQPGDFDDSYNAQAAKAYFSGWGDINDLLTVKAGAKATVLEPAPLLGIHKDLQGNFRRYAEMYLNYWSTDLRDKQLAVSVDRWSHIFEPKNQVGVAQVIGDLLDISKTARESLAALRPYVGPELQQKYDESVAFFGDLTGGPLETFQNDAKTSVESNWSRMPDDPILARQAILQMEAAKFCSDYLYSYNAVPDRLCKKYFADLTFQYLAVLAKESQTSAIKAVQTVQESYCRFPLVKWSANTRPMTPDEVQQARTLLRQISTGAVANGGPQLPIGQGGRCGSDRVNGEFERLRGIKLTRDQETLFQRMRDIADALPDPGKAAQVIVSTVDGNQINELLHDVNKDGAEQQWKRIALCRVEKGPDGQDQITVGEERDTWATRGEELGKVYYPASLSPASKAHFEVRLKPNPIDDFVKNFSRHPIQTGEPADGGDWGVLKMIFTEGARCVASDEKKVVWVCQLPIERKAAWIKLEFVIEKGKDFKPLTDTDKWPAAPRN